MEKYKILDINVGEPLPPEQIIIKEEVILPGNYHLLKIIFYMQTEPSKVMLSFFFLQFLMANKFHSLINFLFQRLRLKLKQKQKQKQNMMTQTFLDFK